MNDTSRFTPRNLFLLTFAILFLEMACIRWMNATIQVLSYFNNLILISSFFGLGVGCLLAGRKREWIAYFSLGLVVLAVAGKFFGEHGITISYLHDVIFVEQSGFYSEGKLIVPISALLAFLANTVFFAMLGQELGNQFRAIGDPLRAYGYDIAGSLAGTTAYALLAWLRTPPLVWFAAGIAILFVILWDRKRWIWANLAGASLALFLISTVAGSAQWSPYYKIQTIPYQDAKLRDHGFIILVDNIRIQDALNFRAGILDTSLGAWVPYYDLPYKVTRPKKILILGAGGGNEVVAAKTYGVQEIHAVEIDPVIAGMGFTTHPNQPYDSPNVRVFVDDARAYISRTQERYDLIVMSALDSHKVISGLSSLRLESFIYTTGAFEQVRKLLKPGGAFCLNLTSTRPWMGERTYWSIAQAFGKEPQILKSLASPFGSVAYFIFEDDRRLEEETLVKSQISVVPPHAHRDEVRLATDNWPFLYLEKNRIPTISLVVITTMFLLSTSLVVMVDQSARKPNLHFFLLGAGFMLLETRSITQMALLFGTTWHVNAIVISSVLAAIYVTNEMVRRGRGLKPGGAFSLLFATLILGYFFPFDLLLSLGWWPRLALSALIVGLPILWASFIFSDSFRKESRPNVALGSNLLGVVLGGSLEYASNIWGLDALYLLALAIYVGAAMCLIGGKSSTQGPLRTVAQT